MNKIHLEPFVNAARETFAYMLGVEIEPMRVSADNSVVSGYDVSGIIGLSQVAEDNKQGSVVLSFPEEVARHAVGRILGTEGPVETLDQDAADAIGELINVIAGAAKIGLEALGIDRVATALPTVILGAQHRVFRLREVQCLRAEFKSEIGRFLLQVFLRPSVSRIPVVNVKREEVQ